MYRNRHAHTFIHIRVIRAIRVQQPYAESACTPIRAIRIIRATHTKRIRDCRLIR